MCVADVAKGYITHSTNEAVKKSRRSKQERFHQRLEPDICDNFLNRSHTQTPENQITETVINPG